MSRQLQEQINQLKQAIAEIEAQRPVLGDTAIEASLEPFHRKLAELESQKALLLETPAPAPTRQRKLVTLLYMDVVGSTAMTQGMDPEDTLEIMDAAIARLAEPVTEYGGHVTRFTGDGFKAVFGDPVARENDPEQAIRAGLAILELNQVLAKEIGDEWGIEQFQVRVGIDTGLAALGGITEGQDTVKGRVVNLAQRIQSAAPPDGLLISHNTFRHVRGVFNVDPQEPIVAKGFPEPVPVYRVLERKPRAFRVQTRGVEGIETRMVGRKAELKYLQDALLTAVDECEGQIIIISGEAGVGKSRLLYEFQNWIELLPEPSVFFFQGRGRQEAQGLPYNLLRDMFAFRFQILDDDSGEQARQKIAAGLCEIFGTEEGGVMRAHILGHLLGFDFSASPHLKDMLNDAEHLCDRAQMYLVQYYQSLSQDDPVVIFLEDLHWADDSSLDVIMRLGEFTPKQQLLIVGAARPSLYERRPYWGEGRGYHALLEMRPLSKRESRQLVVEIMKMATDIPSELREIVVSGAEGNPFYLEELIKMLIENGVVITGEESWRIDLTHIEQVDVPSTLAGVLQARLDSLPIQERTVLQQASVVGRQFWDRTISFMQEEGGNGTEPQQVPIRLNSLRNRELVYRHEESAFKGAVEFLFKHDILREVTYESVVKRRRKIYHSLVADWLIRHSTERRSEYAGLIADHLLKAGRSERASEYLKAAAETALASYANREAEGYFRRALDLFPSGAERADLFSGLGESLSRQSQFEEALEIWRRGIFHYQDLGDKNAVGHLYARSSKVLYDRGDVSSTWDLCQEGLELLEGAPDSRGFAQLLAETGRAALFCGMTYEADTMCQRAISMAERLGDVETQIEARNTLSIIAGDLNKSVSILEEVVALAEVNELLYPSARAHNNLGFMFHGSGNLVSARKHYLQAAEFARKMGHSSWVSGILANLAGVESASGNLQAVDEILKEIMQLKTISPESRAQFYQQQVSWFQLFAKGDWYPSLDIMRNTQEEARNGGDLQALCGSSESFADTVLELKRFTGYSEWMDIESALAETIEISERGIWDGYESNCKLAIVFARQGRLTEAMHQMEESKHTLKGAECAMDQVHRFQAEIELAFADGHWTEAVIACKNRIDISESMGANWITARTMIDLGDALIRRDEPGDLEMACETYLQSLEIFTEMGAPGYIRVLEERLGDIGGRDQILSNK